MRAGAVLMKLRSCVLWLYTAALLAAAPLAAIAGGPRWIAGTTGFDPAVVGQPLRWRGGQVRYFVDQGALSATVPHAQAVAMVDAAADLWSAVPTAGVTLTDAGTLNEDVTSSNVVAGASVFAAPADVTPAATNYPVGVVFDVDGSVIESIFGAGASDVNACQNDGVWTWTDNWQTDATYTHAIILLNGLCANTANRLTMMSFQLERAFGIVLGLGFSQVNPGAFTSGDPNQTAALPVMQPASGACGPSGGNCIPAPFSLRLDDIATLNRLYPITAANLASFPGKQLTAANTISISGTLNFRDGMGMQGVNVVARPLDADGNPLYAYTVSAVSGALFNGKHGNAVTGWTDANGNLLTNWGSNDAAVQGSFDLSYLPLPEGMTSATYQITFEQVSPLYILGNEVGPYYDGSPAPSGTMPVLTVANLAAGAADTETVTISDSAARGNQDAIGTESEPRSLPPGGMWTGRISQIGQADWFVFPVRANRTFSVVAQAANENGAAVNTKAIVALGLWSATGAVGAAPDTWAPGLNGYAAGESILSAMTSSDGLVRLGATDLRGDGRPDYRYVGWVLYADTVSPAHLPASGGPIVIHGTGFRASDTVKVGGKTATVTSTSPTEITAIAPASAATGSVDVEVDDLPIFSAFATISGGVSYDAGTGDSITLITAPMNTVSLDVPLPFTVQALDASLKPASGVIVTFTVTSGTATLGCGQLSCTVTATGDGLATMNVTATTTSLAIVTATLVNGASLQAHFTGGTAPTISAVTPSLSVAAGTSVNWPVQALVLSAGAPANGQTVAWTVTGGITLGGAATTTSNTSGIASNTLTIGALAGGATAAATACVNGTQNCTTFTVLGARPEYAVVQSVAGTSQSIAATATPSQVVLRLRDMNGNPMAGGTVALYQAVYAWAPPCSAHGRCAASQLLAMQTATAVSALDGTVVFTPASLSGVATNMTALAATGNASTLAVAIEQHP
jgi:hypothetical protein